jgi:hypothetical protein
MEPYTAPLIAKLLRAMPIERLRSVRPRDFQTWPAKRIVKAPLIQEIIANELASRRRAT